MRSATVEQFLESLASRRPAPGGRAGTALHVAHGAALVAKVARHGEQADHADHARAADELREVALGLLDEADDEADEEAGRVPVQVVDLAERVLVLVETLLAGTLRPTAGRAVVTDLAAAAEAVRAAAGTARVDVELDLGGIGEPAVREERLAAIEPVDDLVLRAAKVTAYVREQILR